MSKYKEQRLGQIEDERLRRANLHRWVLGIVAVVALTGGVAVWHRNATASKAIAISSNIPTDEKRTLAALLALKPHQIGELDIGLINLLCAEGLRGSETLDLNKCLDRLDEMAT